MNDQEQYKRRIQSAEDLHSIVRSMKVLSSVSIRQFENAVNSLQIYNHTIELAFQVLLKNSGTRVSPVLNQDETGEAGLIIFGSGHGLCGAFDEQIHQFIEQRIIPTVNHKARIIVAGSRLAAMVEKEYTTDKVLEMPGTVDGIADSVFTIISEVDKWIQINRIDKILLVNHHPTGKGVYAPRTQQLYPIDEFWLQDLRNKEWPSNNLPVTGIDHVQLFSMILRQFIWVNLFRSIAESLASEHISRLNSMTMAEKKVAERVDELKSKYRHARQTAITDELLDILSGYIAVSES